MIELCGQKFQKISHQTRRKTGLVTNTVYIDPALQTSKLNASMLTGPAETLQLFETGSFLFNMNWSDLFKHEYQFSQTRSLENPTVLDIGCRHGSYRVIAYRNRQKISYTGIDADTAILKKQFKSFTNCDASFFAMNCSGRKLPFDDATFDVVLMNDIIEHLETPAAGLQLLREGLRICKRLCFIVTPNNPDKTMLLYPNDHKYEYSMQDITDAIARLGLLVSEMYGISITAHALKERLHADPAVTELFSRTMIKSNFLRNALLAQLYPHHSRDVMYVVQK